MIELYLFIGMMCVLIGMIWITNAKLELLKERIDKMIEVIDK